MQEKPQNIDPAQILTEAQELIETEDYENCIKLLSESLISLTSSLGELHESLYKLYYTYGDVLLLHYETENDAKVDLEAVDSILKSASSSDQLTEENVKALDESIDSSKSFSNESQAGSESLSSKLEEVSSPTKAKKTSPYGDPSEAKEENDLDLKLAWENLEISRVILEKLTPCDNSFLFKVQSRLGDLQSYSENFLQACHEYIKASETLALLESQDSNKDLASLHYMIGHNFLFLKGKESDAEAHFRKAHHLLSEHISGVTEPELVSELQAVLEEIEMKIEDAIDQRKSFHLLESNDDRLLDDKEKLKDRFDLPKTQKPVEDVKARQKDLSSLEDNDLKKTI
jgi:hypothetical protein